MVREICTHASDHLFCFSVYVCTLSRRKHTQRDRFSLTTSRFFFVNFKVTAMSLLRGNFWCMALCRCVCFHARTLTANATITCVHKSVVCMCVLPVRDANGLGIFGESNQRCLHRCSRHDNGLVSKDFLTGICLISQNQCSHDFVCINNTCVPLVQTPCSVDEDCVVSRS